MGGQACVFYGAAEFSRDTDLAVMADAQNLSRLQLALDELEAERIAVPPFEPQWLELGLAVHFRCRSAEAAGMRIDVMSKMRGVDDFPQLWERRTTVDVEGVLIDLMSLPDLVQAKKTQRSKDWPMIARLVEASYFANSADPTTEHIEFWFRELRTTRLLVELAQKYPQECRAAQASRALLSEAVTGNEAALQTGLRAEEDLERAADRAYWEPLKRMLEQMRREARGT